MAQPRLSVADTALLVIDMQERLKPTLPQWDRTLRRIRALAQVASILKLPVAATEQSPGSLGPTVEPLRAELLQTGPIFEKTQFSAATAEVESWLAAHGRTNVILCGIEGHVCVLQTALDFCQRGTQTFHCTDAIDCSQPDQFSGALTRMERAGSVATGMTSAIYELMGNAKHPAFRDCLRVVKSGLSG